MAKGRINVYTDGGCIKNPGGRGGFGTVIIDGDNIFEISLGYKSTTNNRMELMAMLAAFEYIEEGREVLIYSDSKYAIGVASGEMKTGKNLDLLKQIHDEIALRNVSFKWVKGHNGNKYNERCDYLASRAMESALVIDGGYASGF